MILPFHSLLPESGTDCSSARFPIKRPGTATPGSPGTFCFPLSPRDAVENSRAQIPACPRPGNPWLRTRAPDRSGFSTFSAALCGKPGGLMLHLLYKGEETQPPIHPEKEPDANGVWFWEEKLFGFLIIFGKQSSGAEITIGRVYHTCGFHIVFRFAFQSAESIIDTANPGVFFDYAVKGYSCSS